MSFLHPRPELEAWLDRASTAWVPLARRDYQELVAKWRQTFEDGLERRRYRTGARAEQALMARLPSDVFVFGIPGYRHSPAATDARTSPAYGYEVDGLRLMEFGVANAEDAIIADWNLTFACLCTHESGALAEPILLEAGGM